MSRVLVTRRLPRAVIERLEAEHDVDVHRGDAQMSVEEFHSRLAPCDGVVVLMPDRIDKAAIDAAPNLKVAANVAVGYDNMDVAYARSRGVICTNTPDVLTDAVADFTWAPDPRRHTPAERRRSADPRRQVVRLDVRVHDRRRAAGQAARNRRRRTDRQGGRRARAAFGMPWPSRAVATRAGRPRSSCRSTSCCPPRTSCRCRCR